MKLVLFGAGGNIGRRIACDALDRGHQVTAAVRDPARFERFDPRLTVVGGDATDPPSPLFAAAARGLIAGATEVGVTRVIVLGGAGSLEVAPGVEAVDTPGFPEAYKGDALGQREALHVWRSRGSDGLDWTYISPAGEIGPGMRTVAAGSPLLTELSWRG